MPLFSPPLFSPLTISVPSLPVSSLLLLMRSLGPKCSTAGRLCAVSVQKSQPCSSRGLSNAIRPPPSLLRTTAAPRRRRSTATLAVAAAAASAKSIDVPDGLRAPPYTGSAAQVDAVRQLMARSSSLVGDIDEETAIWVRMNSFRRRRLAPR